MPLNFYPFEDGYFAITPEGYYAAHGKQYLESIYFNQGNRIIEANQLSKQFHRPDLVAKYLKGEPIPKAMPRLKGLVLP